MVELQLSDVNKLTRLKYSKILYSERTVRLGFGIKVFMKISGSPKSVAILLPNLFNQGVGVKLIQSPTTGAPSKSRGGSTLGRKQ